MPLTMTRDQMVAVIRKGGSVMINGAVYSTEGQLPPDSMLDHADMNALKAQKINLEKEIEELNKKLEAVNRKLKEEVGPKKPPVSGEVVHAPQPAPETPPADHPENEPEEIQLGPAPVKSNVTMTRTDADKAKGRK